MPVSPAALVALPEDGVLTPQALARTYNAQSYADPYESIEDYVRVKKAAAGREVGSSALASELELPRGRIRTWLDGGAPDPARAVAIGARNDWFAADDATTTAWASLVAGVLAGGSIDREGHVPAWTTTPDEAAARVRDALGVLGVEAQLVMRNDRADELKPGTHASVLGRALQALGAPAGDKNADSVGALPDWLLEASASVRRAAAEVLVLYRGHGFDDKDTIELFEGRSREYRESVVQLLRSVVDGAVSPGNHYVVISAAAARELDVGRDGVLRDAIEAE